MCAKKVVTASPVPTTVVPSISDFCGLCKCKCNKPVVPANSFLSQKIFIDFDNIKDQIYIKIPEKFRPCSADTLVQNNGKFSLVEIKNAYAGVIKGGVGNIEAKFIDSLYLLLSNPQLLPTNPSFSSYVVSISAEKNKIDSEKNKIAGYLSFYRRKKGLGCVLVTNINSRARQITQHKYPKLPLNIPPIIFQFKVYTCDEIDSFAKLHI